MYFEAASFFVCQEARSIERCRKLGVAAPTVLKVEATKGKINMEFIEGKTVRDFLHSQCSAEGSGDCEYY